MPEPTTRRRSIAAVVALVGLFSAAAGAWAIVIRNSGDGPVLVEFTKEHGLHRGELPELLAVLLGLALMGLGAWLGRSG